MNETISIFVYMYYTTITKEVFLGGGTFFFLREKRLGGEYHIMTFAFIYMYIALIQKACLKHIKEMFKVDWLINVLFLVY